MGLFERLRRILGGRGTDQRRAGTPALRRPRGRGAPEPDRLIAQGLPQLETRADLARWLGVDERGLAWLCDPHRLAARRRPHYRLILREKREGKRVLLAPRPRLHAAQTRILRGILDRLEPHPAAHGFRRGRDARSNAAAHVGAELVLALDVRDFFHQLTYRDVVGLFRARGYGIEVARALALLTTAPQREMLPGLARAAGVDPRELLQAARQSRRGAHHPMLPQGAPTSPSLANLLCGRLDRRLDALSVRFRASYTRYADDVCFSGGADLRRDLRRFVPLVRRIMRDEGFETVRRKWRFMRKSAQQRVTGLVVNARVNTPANDYRRLRAVLHNCAVHGPAGQNHDGHPRFREHLLGRIGWHASVNPRRGERLMERFERIRW